MFEIISKLLYAVASVGFPIFASFKALKSSQPTLLAPWLMYWIVFASISIFESWTSWLYNWIPLYYEARACLMLWLVLPQTQGATFVYMKYIHPTIQTHEQDIENLVLQTQLSIKKSGMRNLEMVLNHIKQMIQMILFPSTANEVREKDRRSVSSSSPIRTPKSRNASSSATPLPRSESTSPERYMKQILDTFSIPRKWLDSLNQTSGRQDIDAEYEKIDRDDVASINVPKSTSKSGWFS